MLAQRCRRAVLTILGMTSIGIPKEIKSGEARVGLTPAEVTALVGQGHAVRVETGAGTLLGLSDDHYREAGAGIATQAALVYACDIIAKVKEIQPSEFALLRSGQILCGFAQIARDTVLLDALLNAGVSVVAYEAIKDVHGNTPVLAPMSHIAGTLSASIAQWCLQTAQGGRGVLLGPGARVVIVGAGVSGLAAAEAFYRLGCAVTVVLRDPQRARSLLKRLPIGVHCVAIDSLPNLLPQTDVLIGAVSVPGALSPKLITEAMMGTLPKGAVFVDIGIDMGGISETSKQTTWSAPIYVAQGVVHFCVANIPAQVPQAATAALAAAALPYLQAVASQGVIAAAKLDAGLAAAVQVFAGSVTSPSVARDTGRSCQQLL